MVGIAVVNLSGEHPAIGQSALRFFLKSLQPLGIVSRWSGTPSSVAAAAVGTAWDILLLVTIASNGQGQGLHDRVVRTVVVNVTRRESLTSRLSGRGAPRELTIVERFHVPKPRIRVRR
jgi:uncharacterized RDD family membrane protein YckC